METRSPRIHEHPRIAQLDVHLIAIPQAQPAELLRPQVGLDDRVVADLQRIRVDTERELGAARERRAKVEQRQADAEALRASTLALVDAAPIDPALIPQLEALCAEVLGEHQLTVESCDNREKEVRDLLQTRIDAEDLRLKRLAEKKIAVTIEAGAGLGAKKRLLDVDGATVPGSAAAG